MDRPSKITFLDSTGTAAFEYRVPKGQSHMVRRHFPPICFLFDAHFFPSESKKSAPVQLFVVVTLNCGWRPHACFHPDTSFPAKIHTSPHWVTGTRARRGRRPLNAGPAICAIIFLINVCERWRERGEGGGGGIFLMLHHRAAEGQRALLIKMEIRLELQVMRWRNEAAFLLRAVGKRQPFPVWGL